MADKSMADLNDLSVREEKKIDTTGKKLRIGFIGCGWIAGAHINSYKKQPDVETVIPILNTNGDLFDLKIRTFLDAIKNGTPAPIPSSQIIYNQAIIDGIAKSAELGHEIEIVIPEI